MMAGRCSSTFIRCWLDGLNCIGVNRALEVETLRSPEYRSCWAGIVVTVAKVSHNTPHRLGSPSPSPQALNSPRSPSSGWARHPDSDRWLTKRLLSFPLQRSRWRERGRCAHASTKIAPSDVTRRARTARGRDRHMCRRTWSWTPTTRRSARRSSGPPRPAWSDLADDTSGRTPGGGGPAGQTLCSRRLGTPSKKGKGVDREMYGQQK